MSSTHLQSTYTTTPTIPDDFSFGFDFSRPSSDVVSPNSSQSAQSPSDQSNQERSRPKPSIESICDNINTTIDQLYHTLTITLLHLTAQATTSLESIPSPADGTKTLKNPFLLEFSHPSATTMLALNPIHMRQLQIKSVLDREIERDRNTYKHYSDQLGCLIRELIKFFPLNTNTPQKNTPTHPKISNVNVFNISTLSNNEVMLVLHDLYQQNVLQWGNIDLSCLNTPDNNNKYTTKHQFSQLLTKESFSTHAEYIAYLKEYRRELYYRVKDQSDIIENLHQRAIKLQQSLALYRGQ